MKYTLLLLSATITTAQCASVTLANNLNVLGTSVQSNILAPDLTITASSPSTNQILVFNSDIALPNNADPDLHVFQGYALAISEDGNLDDEANGGTLTFSFTESVTSFQFVGIDLDEDLIVTYLSAGGKQTAGVYSTANAGVTSPITYNFTEPTNKIKFKFEGSGAISNIQYETIPEPNTTALLGLSALGLILRRRR